MKIAIIGGGAAGMICAYLLDKAGYKIAVFEKQDKLGGHIRTLNKNVAAVGIEKDLYLEAGVIEFSEKFSQFRDLMNELDVELLPVEIGTGLFTKHGKPLLSQVMIKANRKGSSKWLEYFRYYWLQLSLSNLGLRMNKNQNLAGLSIEDFLRKKNKGTIWLKNLLMYSYSTPFEQIAAFPAELGIPALRDYMFAKWFRMKGGVYTYIEKILERFTGRIFLNARVDHIIRNETGVSVQWNSRNKEAFDKLVIATPPDQVLKLLNDADENEKRIFEAWKANHAETIIHTDNTFYRSYNIQKASPFDFFETEFGWAYNACLNELCQTNSAPYFLSFNMQSRIQASKIVHRQKHHTPLYTVDAHLHREELIRRNGNNNTYYVGAYLSDGLHEGAVISAKAVERLLGKR